MRLKELLEDYDDDKKTIQTKVHDWISKIPGEKPSFAINADGSIEIYGNLHIHDENLIDGKLPPFNFSLIQELMIFAETFNSFENFPECLDARFGSSALSFNGDFSNVTSLEGISSNIKGSIYLNKVPNLNYSKCNRHLKRITQGLVISPRYEGPILSIFLIKDLEECWLSNLNQRNTKLNAIIDKIMQTDRDILDAQETLIQAGLKEYAKL